MHMCHLIAKIKDWGELLTEPNNFFLISNKNILKRRRVSPKYTRHIHQGQK